MIVKCRGEHRVSIALLPIGLDWLGSCFSVVVQKAALDTDTIRTRGFLRLSLKLDRLIGIAIYGRLGRLTLNREHDNAFDLFEPPGQSFPEAMQINSWRVLTKKSKAPGSPSR